MIKTLLAVGAHADDCEIGAGGLLLQAVQAGCRVVLVTVVGDFDTWSLTRGRAKETRRDLLDVAHKYGFEKRFLDYPYHVIDGGDLDLKRQLSKIYGEVKPEATLIHQLDDHWPDHVACGRAAHDAVLFAHGLTEDLDAPRCPLVYSYVVTPMQTTHFEEDTCFDVSEVMPQYMELINETVAAYHQTPLKDEIIHELNSRGSRPLTLRMGKIALTRLAYCIQHGHRAGCDYGIGFKTVWGQRRAEKLF